jgi:hypothetical protein
VDEGRLVERSGRTLWIASHVAEHSWWRVMFRGTIRIVNLKDDNYRDVLKNQILIADKTASRRNKTGNGHIT